jgi:DNA-binding MarR family transcriptional regulator
MADPLEPLGHQHAIEIATLVHRLMERRLGREFYSVPALDMLYDLYLRNARRPRSLSNLCGASRVPVRTALRTINRLVRQGLLARSPDPLDARRTNVEITPRGVALLDELFAELAARSMLIEGSGARGTA